ncbi:MAG: hypothetical protein U1B83_06880, partial [Candidatus Cloacimonadaceae bacterium]|nr:hypothetical protein [Candidatus Cloacimonadaceae bacterium]
HHVFGNLSNGIHQMQVCAVDLQGAISDPVTVEINLLPYKPVSQRSGILVVDDSMHHNSYSPEAFVDSFYSAVVPGVWGEVAGFETNAGTTSFSLVSPGLMQNYSAVLWHSDNPSSSGSLVQSIDALELYLAGGGNLVLSGTNRLEYIFGQFSYHQDFLLNRFGIASLGQITALSHSVSSKAFFVNAIGQNGPGDIPLNLQTPFNSIVSLRQGLSLISYFDPDADLDFLYRFGCKAIDAPYPPTQEEYDLYSEKYVAYKYSNAGAKVVVFGFPLSYMAQAEVATGLQSVFSDLLGGNFAKGGRP